MSDLPRCLETEKPSLPEMKPIKTLAMEALDHLEEHFQKKVSMSGLSTGFREIDLLTDGLQPGELVVLASNPEAGKTSLATNIIEHIAVKRQLGVFVFCPGMSARQFVIRLLASSASVSLHKARDGVIEREKFGNLISATQRLAETRLFLDDTDDLSPGALCRRSRQLKQRENIKLIVVDSLPMLEAGECDHRENRPQKIGSLLGELRALARELNIPVLILTSLKRSFGHRSARKRIRPTLFDLRDSPAILKHAQTIFLLHREQTCGRGDGSAQIGDDQAELIVAKQRNGPLGVVPLTFCRHSLRFSGTPYFPDVD